MAEAAVVEAEITVLEITAKNDPIRAFKAIYGFYFLVEAGVFATLISISGATLFKCPAEPKLPQSVLGRIPPFCDLTIKESSRDG